MSRLLPKLFGWVFTVLAVLCGISVIAVIAVMIAHPSLPADAHFGPLKGDLLGQPAQFSLHAASGERSEPAFSASAFNGTLTMTIEKTGGMIAVLERYGLPLALSKMLFLTALFEVLRRLFRNVGRGDSFTPQSVRLVQIIGFLLIGFSIVAGLAGSLFASAAYDYFAQHTQIAVSGTPVRLPAAGSHPSFSLMFSKPMLFSGLLVLALSEVFRQGLALQRENDLTV